MAKKGSKAKKSSSSKKSEANVARRQITSVILFAAAVFFLFVVFIKGQNVWAWLHNVMFGIFGITAYYFPFLLGFIAVVRSMDKAKGSLIAKTVEISAVVVFIGAAVDIFSASLKLSLWEHLVLAFEKGVHLKSGGFLGGIIGKPLCMAFDKTGAAITVILIIFVLLMIFSGTTLMKLFNTVSKPVKAISEQAETAYQERLERNEKSSGKKLRVIKGFNPDVEVDDDDTEVKKEKPATIEDRKKKLVSTYHDIPIPDEPELPEGAEDKGNMDKALKATAKEAVLNDGEVIDVKKETIKFKEELENESGTAADNGYVYPPVSLLNASQSRGSVAAGTEAMAEHLVETLRSFGVETRIVNVSRGPTVTRYELQPCAGVKISKITNLADDIALNLATAGVRIEAPIPNKAAVGIEVPNKTSDVVDIRSIIESPVFSSAKSKLTVALGRDIGGNEVVTDITKMPHCLIAGATGSGKSVCINSIIMSILYKASPEEVKLLMIDPKVVELGIYNGIPHLLLPVVTDPRKAASTLGWAVSEMEKRYQMFAASSVRDIDGYNKVAEADPEMVKLPRIVIIVDELADLMMSAPKEVEDSINRIAAKARAAGMHLIIATQRPSVDVVTGVIKANIPSRIAFAVSSQIDSRTILDNAGAEKLLGRGDMLYSPLGSTKPSRVQGCFVSDEEVEAVTDFVKGRHTFEYDQSIMEDIENRVLASNKDKAAAVSSSDDDGDDDPMLMPAIEFVVESRQASTSMLQRKLKLGYARAARIMDTMADMGVIGPYNGAKPREVLITMEQWLEKKASEE